MSARPTLILYSRPHCDLCEAMEDQLHAEFAGRFELDWRDVDRDPETQRRFGARIPVLTTSSGQEVCVGQFHRASVVQALGPLEATSGPV